MFFDEARREEIAAAVSLSAPRVGQTFQGIFLKKITVAIHLEVMLV